MRSRGRSAGDGSKEIGALVKGVERWLLPARGEGLEGISLDGSMKQMKEDGDDADADADADRKMKMAWEV